MPNASIAQVAMASSRGRASGGGPINVPSPLTSFIGRERELAEAARLLASSRLLTLTGPGGSGKTRLGIELAAAVANDYPDGVYFVPLTAIRDPGLVPSSIAQSIGLQDARDLPLLEHLAGYLRQRRILLVLDNFEHLLAAGPVVAQLLTASRDLRVIVSSRSPLHLSGEQECPVPPLTLPDPRSAAPAAAATCESIRLFVDRAAASVPGFAVDERNAGCISRIVLRVDGLPLAIELAAARVKLLPPEAILTRLEHSLGLLVGGSRDLPDRQQTLRSTIAWSYDLLSPGARRLLATCSVFRAVASLEIIESICSTAVDIGMPVLDGLQELVDQSLLRQVQTSGTPRYAMLETIREFAAERLAQLPEAARVHSSHAAAFAALAQQVGRPMTGPADQQWLERLDIEHDNIRAAVDWYQQTDPPAALRLTAAMSGFWSLHGHFTEGRRRLHQLLEFVSDQDRSRVGALNGAAWLAIDQGDHPAAGRLLAQSLEVSRRLEDRVGEGMASLYQGRSRLARSLVSEGAPCVEHAATLLSEANDQQGVAISLFYSGLVAHLTDRPAAACELYTRCADLSQELGFRALRARALQQLGLTRLDLGDLKASRAALEEGLPVTIEIGDRWIVPIGLFGFAALATRTGRPRLALRLAGAAEAYRRANEFSVPPAMKAIFDRQLAPSHQAVGTAAAKLLAEGAQMPLETAVACALADAPEEAWRSGPGPALTHRETEVAALVARGLSNRDIAARLFLSVRTVEVHVDHILTKLGFRSRTQLTAWAHQEGLLPPNT